MKKPSNPQLDVFNQKMRALYSGPAPSVISETSAQAASKVTDPMRANSYRKIFAALVAYGALTRERLVAITGMKESSACARLFELRPTFVKANSGAGKSSAGLSVDTYELTDIGLDRWKAAT